MMPTMASALSVQDWHSESTQLSLEDVLVCLQWKLWKGQGGRGLGGEIH